MRRPILIFLGAVLVPGLLLAVLAWRSIQGQEAVLLQERLRRIQSATEVLAQAISGRIDEHQRDFSLRVESLFGKEAPRQLAQSFDDRIRDHWPLARLGFAVSLSGDILSPPILGRPEARQFLVSNNEFLCNRSSVQVFAVTPKGKIDLTELNRTVASTPLALESGAPSAAALDGVRRFAQLVGDAQEGVLARFVDDRPVIWVWYRTPREPDLVFGAELALASLRLNLGQLVESTLPPMPGVVLALLDDRARVVGTSRAVSAADGVDWNRPTASAAVGPSLPTWRAAASIVDPGAFQVETRRLRFTLAAVISLLVAAIAIGGLIVATDARRQLDLARRKTDFVSNVSHELRTPLTSIRLFAEMLAEDRVTDPSKRRRHLHIIRTEAGRLHRLIGNILDFARHERGEHRLNLAPVDLTALTREVLSTFTPHFDASGMVLHDELPSEPVQVQADPDGLAQIVHNLATNAVKYASQGRELTVRLVRQPARVSLEFLDRGPGIPADCRERIFDEFFRTDDALASGIPGAGLGLTLARRIARAHGGEITGHPRPDGGCCFRVDLPAGAPVAAPFPS